MSGDFGWIADSAEKIGHIEASLVEQGVQLFPTTTTGERARSLWRQMKPHLLRGGAVDFTLSGLGFKIHRQELKRARDVLIDMGLIKRSENGRYVLGPQGRHSKIDDLIREEFSALKLLVGVLIALEALSGKVKDPGKPSSS